MKTPVRHLFHGLERRALTATGLTLLALMLAAWLGAWRHDRAG